MNVVKIDEDGMAQRWLEDRLSRAFSSGGPVSERIWLNPSLARLLLAANPDNRSIKKLHLDRMVRDIEAGRWEFNGETVIVAATGELNDGQHRCEAVIRAGRAIETMIVIGVRREARYTTDRGTLRSTGDVLSMSGLVFASSTASAARICSQFEIIGRVSDDPHLDPTNQEIVEWVHAHPRINEIAAIYHANKATRGVAGPSVLTAMHYLIEQKDKEAAAEFFSAFSVGHMLDLKSPAGLLRTRLLNKTNRLRRAEICELIVRAWNAHRERRPFAKLILGDHFPTIAG